MTQAMAARDDRFDYEGEISSDSERGQALMRKMIADYTTETLAILHALDCFGITVEQVHEHHKKLAKQVLLQINAESRNEVEQAALTAMVGTSLLATFDAMIDHIKLEIDLIDMERGADGSTGR